jgi:lysylphosphatidylglycerol synthetase-like protein (DUF2156 family)
MNDTPSLGGNDEHKPRGRARRTLRAKLAYAAVSFWGMVLATVLIADVIWLSLNRGLGRLVELGLLQPMLAALLALMIVLGIWLAKGRYVDEQRKGVRSASSSTIAIRLWALCFVLLFSAMMLAALVTSVQRQTITFGGASNSKGKIEIESDATAAGNSTSIKVSQ